MPLNVIYNTADAVEVKCHLSSALNHRDLLLRSFHAVKFFNTFQGGAIVCPNAITNKRIYNLKILVEWPNQARSPRHQWEDEQNQRRLWFTSIQARLGRTGATKRD